jgi:hypothetical protein
MAGSRGEIQHSSDEVRRALAVAHGAKQVTAEIEISYDNDPPLGIRTVWQKVEYLIAWLDMPLFNPGNVGNVVEHREGPC